MIFFEDQHGLCCSPRSEITAIEPAFPDRLRIETMDGTVGYCYEAAEVAQIGPCPYASKRTFATDQLRRIQCQEGSLLLTLASGEVLKVTPKWVPSVRKFLGLDRYRPQPESLTRIFLREYPFTISRARVELLQVHFGDARSLIANLIWQAREVYRPHSQVMHGRSHRGFWYASVESTLERVGFINERLSKEAAEALYLRQLSQMVYDDRLFDYRDLGFEDEFASQRGIGASRPDIILVIEKKCISSIGIKVAEELGISWIITGGIARHVAVEFFCDALHKVYQGSVIVVDFGDFDPGGHVAGNSFVQHLERYNTTCLSGPHFVTKPELFTEEELDLFSRPLTEKDGRVDEWLLRTGGINGKARGMHADHLHPPERVRKALLDILETLTPEVGRGAVDDVKGFLAARLPARDQAIDAIEELFAEKQRQATEYLAAIQDPIEKKIMSMAYRLMISSLLQDSARAEKFANSTFVFEPLEFFKILKRMLTHKELLQGLLSGKYATLEEGCDDLGIF
jgi:hypothetical protein